MARTSLARQQMSDAGLYNQTDGGAGQIYVDYSAVEGVTVAALLFP